MQGLDAEQRGETSRHNRAPTMALCPLILVYLSSSIRNPGLGAIPGGRYL